MSWSREGEDGCIACGIVDAAAIECESFCGELIEISGGVTVLNGVLEGEDVCARSRGVDGVAIGTASFKMESGLAAGVDDNVFGKADGEVDDIAEGAGSSTVVESTPVTVGASPSASLKLLRCRQSQSNWRPGFRLHQMERQSQRQWSRVWD